VSGAAAVAVDMTSSQATYRTGRHGSLGSTALAAACLRLDSWTAVGFEVSPQIWLDNQPTKERPVQIPLKREALTHGYSRLWFDRRPDSPVPLRNRPEDVVALVFRPDGTSSAELSMAANWPTSSRLAWMSRVATAIRNDMLSRQKDGA